MHGKKKPYEKPEASRQMLEQQLWEANEELWLANKKLASEEKARKELLQNLSHDLRAPLAALSGTTELLERKIATKAGEEEYGEILHIMKIRLQTLQTMIEDLFLLTSVENPAIRLSTETIRIGIFLEEYFYSCETDQRFEHRILTLEVEPDFPCTAEIDVSKMVRVLDNLFGNALRYTKEGDQICLSAFRRKTDGEIWITVSDTGAGISPEDIPHVFERTYRADRSRTPRESGNGLGLAIAKGIVEKHGGRIWCESTPGQGSRFTVALKENGFPCT